MKTTVEINGYFIDVEEKDGVISVTATFEDEVVEEFSIEIEEGQESQDDESQEDVQGFDEFGQEEEEDFEDEESEEENYCESKTTKLSRRVSNLEINLKELTSALNKLCDNIISNKSGNNQISQDY